MIKVLGIGNRLMTDDGIAVAVLENIRESLELSGMEVLICETDVQYCFQFLKDDDFVIILDATYSDRPAGSIQHCRLQEAITAYGELSSQHDLSIFDFLRLFEMPMKGHYIGIEISEIGFGCELSEVIKDKFNDICYEIEELIKELVKEC